MWNYNNLNALQEGKDEEGHKLGYSMEIDTKYNIVEEFRKPGYARFPEGRVGTRYDDLPEGGYSGGSVGRTRAVTKRGLSAQADGPCGYVGNGGNNDEAFAGGEGCLREAEVHACPFGVGVPGPGGEGNFQIGNKGLKVDGGANVALAKVQVGPVKVRAGVGMKGALRAGCGGLGAIVPGVGGAVVAKDGLELAVGPFNFKIGW